MLLHCTCHKVKCMPRRQRTTTIISVCLTMRSISCLRFAFVCPLFLSGASAAQFWRGYVRTALRLPQRALGCHEHNYEFNVYIVVFTCVRCVCC